MRYEIWTNETNDPAREYFGFDGYRPGAHMKLAYSNLIASNPDAHDAALERLFEKFNIDQPADYKAHSLSVGDVVVLIDSGVRTAYACESCGWKALLVFDPTLKNPAWGTR
jgi:hypothetical protein